MQPNARTYNTHISVRITNLLESGSSRSAVAAFTRSAIHSIEPANWS